MQKLLLISLIAAFIALPIAAARETHPALALKKVLLFIGLFDFAYLFAIRFVYPRLF